MPTSLTGAKKLAATAAWLAEPPSSREFSRQGVLIESKAVEPTTRTLIIERSTDSPSDAKILSGRPRPNSKGGDLDGLRRLPYRRFSAKSADSAATNV